MARQIIIRRVPHILLCRLEKQTSRMMLARKCWLFGSLGGNSRSRSVLGITCYWCLRLENQGSERHIDSKWCSLWQRSRAVEKIAMIVEDWVVAESLSMLRELLIKLVATTWMLLSGSVWLLTLLLLGKLLGKYDCVVWGYGDRRRAMTWWNCCCSIIVVWRVATSISRPFDRT